MSTHGATLQVRRFRAGLISYLFNSRLVSPQWRSIQVEIGQQTPGFNIEFNGLSQTRYGFFQDIAIDNIVLINCAQQTTPNCTQPGNPN